MQILHCTGTCSFSDSIATMYTAQDKMVMMTEILHFLKMYLVQGVEAVIYIYSYSSLYVYTMDSVVT